MIRVYPETIAEAEHWVVSLTAMPPGVVSEAPAGGFVAGSQDKIIRVYDVEVSGAAFFALVSVMHLADVLPCCRWWWLCRATVCACCWATSMA